MKQKIKPEVMYATMNPWKLFFIVALPGMIGMFTMSIYSVFEGVFIGHTLGEGAFAAVNIAFPLVMINFSLSDLVGVGSSAPISIALGRGDNKTANNIFSCSLVMIFISAVTMGLIMFFAAEPMARMMGASDELLETSVKYLRICAVFSPITTLSFSMDNYLKICGYVKTSMFINIALNAITISLLFVFLLVFKMDVTGSALATSISFCITSVAALIPFITKKTMLRFAKPRFSFALIKQIVKCGSPIFLNNISGRLTSILINISLMTLGVKALGIGGGTTAVAVYGVTMYASDLCWPLLYGIADSLAPALGYNWGAENYERVKRIAKRAFIGTGIVAAISSSVLFFFPGLIASLYVKEEDIKFLQLATHAVRFMGLAFVFRWISVTAQSFLSAIEKPAKATIVSVATAFVFPVLLLGALWNFELDGIWLNHAGVCLLAAILSFILVASVWKEIKKKESENVVSHNVSDRVSLKKEHDGLAAGTVGTIVYKYDSVTYDVEFFDCNANSLGIFTVPKIALEASDK